jgi:hypothetical protein
MRRSPVVRNAGLREDERPGPFRIWTLCAILWLAQVAGLSIYDHQRAIGRLAESHLPEDAAAYAIQWLIAATEYAGEAIAFYGLLPLSITFVLFVLFVLFLPWAVPWAQGGEYED